MRVESVTRWLAAVPVVLASVAFGAPYKVVDLTPPGLPAGVGARIWAVHGDWAVGSAVRGAIISVEAIAWDLRDGSSVRLHTSPAWRWSEAQGVFGDAVVGLARDANEIHAVRWTRTGGQWTPQDIRPAGSTLSAAADTWGNFTVGNVSYDDAVDLATLWSHNGGGDFTADLTPTGYEEGAIRAIDGSRQVGIAWDDSRTHAVLWRLTRESAVSLHPTRDPEFYRHSWGHDVHGDQQVGWAGTGHGAVQHAMLWRDTAESAVDLNPAGYVYSEAEATNGRQQAGYAAFTGGWGEARAMVWSGTAESAVDLHALLGGDFVRSYAKEIDAQGNVYGQAIDAAGVSHAIKWAVVPEPGAVAWVGVALWWLARRKPTQRVGVAPGVSTWVVLTTRALRAPRWLAAAPVLLAPVASAAPYRAVELTAPGTGGSVGAMFRGVHGDWAVGGTVRNGVAVQAMVWDLRSGEAVSLHSPAWTYSDAAGVFGDRVVGYARHPNGQIQALQWTLTGGQWVATDIRPAGATYSTARDTSGNYSAGASAYGDAVNRATLWSHAGGGHFALDITPAGYEQAVIEGIDGSRQVGYAWDDFKTHAILWRLTRDSAVSLHPTRNPEFYKYSWGQEAGGGQQVGWAGTGLGAVQHAMVWQDTAESAVDLNPPGYVFSEARDTNGRQQVGYASLTGGFGNGRAMVWSGRADSGVDLHALLEPGAFVRSYGFAIDEAGNVYGHAIDSMGVYHAIKWEPVPEPGASAWTGIALVWLGRRRSRNGI